MDAVCPTSGAPAGQEADRTLSVVGVWFMVGFSFVVGVPVSISEFICR
jgi:hypothetical protein